MSEEFLNIMKSQKGYAAKFNDGINKVQMRAVKLLHELNQLSPDHFQRKEEILKELFQCGNASKVIVVPPFHCDYGMNIHFEGFAFINFNCSILDTSPVTIGEDTFFGPGVCISCAGHAIHPDERKRFTTSKPIHIGRNVWIGANATILAGVSIGDGSVIGAGSVVSKDIPDHVIAVGVPCKVIRKITDQDRLNLETGFKTL